MMSKNFLRVCMNIFILGLVSLVVLNSCKKDDEDDQPSAKDPIASFQFEISESNYLEVTFTNFSKNASSYTWDFGDGETSTEKDPVHTYAEAGSYTVKLTAKNDAGSSADYSQDLTITDPDEAYKLLTGEESKTWKLFREGVSMSLGPNAEDPAGWWAGLENNGARPCLYFQEFTFYYDGTYEFNDNGEFWGEFGVFDGMWNYEICFEAIPENMINKDGVDVSAWLSGTHAFTYDPSVGQATINGLGAWIGIPKLTTAGETTVPVESTTFNVEITQETGYDLMTVSFDYGDGGYWQIVYASYSDPSLEPDVVLEEDPYGEDLPDLTPDELYNTFETPDSYVVLDTAHAYGAASAANNMELTIGVADPAGAGVNVAEYVRIGMYQELQFFMEYDIQFDNFTTLSLDVYMPSSNDYSGSLTKGIAIIIGEHSETEEWWTGHIQYDVEATVLDEWVTYTFNLDEPTSGPGTYTPFTNDKLDFFAISLGGGGHEDQGTFYIRNFKFE
ncbi:MAG: PKD domain-containing protein [Bacteroidales bacterium]|nr:PKD domain-containing protein [Bacteroidales bacterium]MCF8386432.1 PKD domain-containing protein [Bacteroidales bacterium]MCF8397142.1 PKD domain-containing protein [Bacteroidales bacterium]